MSKISIEDVTAALQETKIPKESQGQILNRLQQIIAEEQAIKEENKLPKQKNEFGVILFDPEGLVAGKEFTAAVYQIPQGDDHSLVLGKIAQAAGEQNAAAKRKKFQFDTLGSAIQGIKRKFIKEKNVNLKTKNPVTVLISNNKLG